MYTAYTNNKPGVVEPEALKEILEQISYGTDKIIWN